MKMKRYRLLSILVVITFLWQNLLGADVLRPRAAEERTGQIVPLKGFGGQEPTWYGRTAVVELGNGMVQAFKFLLEGQALETLEHEAQILTEQYGTLGIKIVQDESGTSVFRFKEKLKGKPGIKLDKRLYCISYIVDKSYFKYATEKLPSSMPTEKRYALIRSVYLRNVNQLAFLLRKGCIHETLVRLSHADNKRRWVWDFGMGLPDMLLVQHGQYRGAGMVPQIKENLKEPNMRYFGIADPEHIYTISYQYVPHYIGQNLFEWALAVAYTGQINGLNNQEIESILIEGLAEYYKKITGSRLPTQYGYRKKVARFIERFTSVSREEVNVLSPEDFEPIHHLIRDIVRGVENSEFARGTFPRYKSFSVAKGQSRDSYEFSSLITDSLGRVWIADSQKSCLRIFNEKGKALMTIATTGDGEALFRDPQAISFDKMGRTWIADSGNNRIIAIVVLPNGKIEEVCEFHGEAKAGKLRMPSDIAVDSAGKAWVVDKTDQGSRLQVFSGEGNLLYTAGSFHQKKDQVDPNPIKISIDQQDRVWVADNYTHTIKVFSNDGELLFEFGHYGRGKGEFMMVQDISVDENGKVWVLESGDSGVDNRIQVFDRFGKFLFEFGSEGQGIGRFVEPTSIAVDEFGKTYVLDEGNITIITPADTARYNPLHAINAIFTAVLRPRAAGERAEEMPYAFKYFVVTKWLSRLLCDTFVNQFHSNLKKLPRGKKIRINVLSLSMSVEKLSKYEFQVRLKGDPSVNIIIHFEKKVITKVGRKEFSTVHLSSQSEYDIYELVASHYKLTAPHDEFTLSRYELIGPKIKTDYFKIVKAIEPFVRATPEPPVIEVTYPLKGKDLLAELIRRRLYNPDTPCLVIREIKRYSNFQGVLSRGFDYGRNYDLGLGAYEDGLYDLLAAYQLKLEDTMFASQLMAKESYPAWKREGEIYLVIYSPYAVAQLDPSRPLYAFLSKSVEFRKRSVLAIFKLTTKAQRAYSRALLMGI